MKEEALSPGFRVTRPDSLMERPARMFMSLLVGLAAWGLLPTSAASSPVFGVFYEDTATAANPPGAGVSFQDCISGPVPPGSNCGGIVPSLPTFTGSLSRTFGVPSTGPQAFFNVQGTANLGSLRGVADFAALAGGSGANSIGDGGNASVEVAWADTVTIVAPTLPAGSPVQLLESLMLHSTVSCPDLGIGDSANVAVSSGGLSIIDRCADGTLHPPANRTVTRIITATVGTPLSVGADMSLEVFVAAPVLDSMGQVVSTSGEALADAANTAIFNLDPITPNVSYTTASGVTYFTSVSSVSERASLTLLGPGLIGVAWLRRRLRAPC